MYSLLSGAADGNISVWDLEKESTDSTASHNKVSYEPTGNVVKQKFGVKLSWFPFDSLAFISSSYDHTIKIYDTTNLQHAATFDLASIIYAHAISTIASHLLIACGTQQPAVRLVDLRSASTTHSLVGHGGGPILSVGWSPKEEHILASGGSDGNVHVWDIRRSDSSLGVLDMDDSIGIAGYGGLGETARKRQRGKAHIGPVNGLVWSEDGRHLVSTGHDERVRVWDMSNGANTLANFGPLIRNAELAALSPVLTPKTLTPRNEEILFFPNGAEILMYELFEGRLLKRLKAQSGVHTSSASRSTGQRNSRNRVVDMTWRAHQIELLSAHSDGSIRSWRPRTSVDAFADEGDTTEETGEGDSESRKRKRQTLDDIYKEITTPRVTFI